jgi:hypothetical protein
MPSKILFGPDHPKPTLDIALALKPPGFDLVIHDNGTPEFYRAPRMPSSSNGFDNILRVSQGRKPRWVVPELESVVK